MDRARITTIVRDKIAGVLGVPAAEVTETTDLRDEYQVDSLELMEMGARLETAFGVRLQVEDLEDMINVGHVVDVLARRLGVAA